MKRLIEFLFWMGVLLACVPLMMHGFGSVRQGQLETQFEQKSSPASVEHDDIQTDDGLVRLRIPKLNLKAIVVGGVGETALAEGPGHFPETASPGEPGNCVIAAHRNVWGCWFANLDQLRPGDPVILETESRHFVYKVTSTGIISPNDETVLKSHQPKRELTLLTCTLPPTHRIVVHGVLDKTGSSA